MIKKYILWLFVLLFSFISFSSAWYVRQIWNYWYSPYDDSVNINVNIKWTLMSEQLWITKNVLYYDNVNKVFFYWGSDWIPYIYNRWTQGRFLSYYICDEIITSNENRPWNCVLQNISEDSIIQFENILGSITMNDYRYFDNYRNNSYSQPMFYSDTCFSSSQYWKSLCFFSCAWYYCWWSSSAPKYNNIIDLWFFDNSISFSTLSRAYLYSSPWVNSPSVSPSSPVTWDTQIIDTDLDRYIDYYESRYNWDERMCYVWTYNFNAVWNDPLDLYIWTWWTIFSLYHHVYWSFWINIIRNVWKWINVWIWNYQDFYFIKRHEFWNDNWPDHDVSLIQNFTWDYFINQPVALQWMINYLLNYYNVDPSDTYDSDDWFDVAYYCNLKLNYNRYKNDEESFKDIEKQLPEWDKNVVTDWYNRNINNGGLWTWRVGFSVPDLNWSWGETMSWNVLPEWLDPINLFKDFFTRVTDSINSFQYSNNPIIPIWITYPLLMLVLFRIFKH